MAPVYTMKTFYYGPISSQIGLVASCPEHLHIDKARTNYISSHKDLAPHPPYIPSSFRVWAMLGAAGTFSISELLPLRASFKQKQKRKNNPVANSALDARLYFRAPPL